MSTSDVKVTEGSGKNVATYSFTEDAETKQGQRIVINNSSGTEIGTSSNPVQVTVANTGSNSTAIKVDGSAVTQPISGAITGSVVATLTPTTSGGWNTYHLVSAASTNPTSIKASGGQVGGWYIYNNNAAMRKVVLHDKASAPTAGVSVLTALPIPALGGANVEFTQGLYFSSGIGITTVTGMEDSSTSVVGANDLNINIYYK